MVKRIHSVAKWIGLRILFRYAYPQPVTGFPGVGQFLVGHWKCPKKRRLGLRTPFKACPMSRQLFYSSVSTPCRVPTSECHNRDVRMDISSSTQGSSIYNYIHNFSWLNVKNIIGAFNIQPTNLQRTSAFCPFELISWDTHSEKQPKGAGITMRLNHFYLRSGFGKPCLKTN